MIATPCVSAVNTTIGYLTDGLPMNVSVCPNKVGVLLSSRDVLAYIVMNNLGIDDLGGKLCQRSTNSSIEFAA